jgi:hypothetical protein
MNAPPTFTVCDPANLQELRRLISEAKPRQPTQLEQPAKLSHGWLLPCLLHADNFLWRRWHHWLETAVAGKVIAPIPPIEWQRHDLGFKILDRCLSAISKHGDWRGWGSWTAFDYFMDWLLYGLGHRGQNEPPEEKVEFRGASDRLYQVFNLETLLAYPHDYLGDILAENHHGRHVGFYPTPMHVCEFMARMTVGGEDARTKSVCDPCVGTGRLLLAASNYSYRLYGCDINPTVIKATLINGYVYAPWLVRPFPFLDAPLCEPSQSENVSDAIAAQTNLQGTEHDSTEQWKFEPIKKRRKIGEPAVEQGILFTS